MNRLNVFNPYQSKEGYHEDQLTRAYLILLKHSFHVFSYFIDYCRRELPVIDQSIFDSQKEGFDFSFSELFRNGLEIETQKSNPHIDSSFLLSVLISDERLEYIDFTTSSQRNARYDGLIGFGDYLTIIIENKPKSTNVWMDQTNPSKTGLSPETKIYPKPISLKWRDIISDLNSINELQLISKSELFLIEDFLDYINENFPLLNPYEKLHLCKGNKHLIKKRIELILKEIVLDESSVSYHKDWGLNIQVPYGELKKIGLLITEKSGQIIFELSFYFGNTQSQAKAFFQRNPNIPEQENNGWWFMNNFHLSFQASNLVTLNSSIHYSDYIDFWLNSPDLIHQRKKADLNQFLTTLQQKNILIIDEKKVGELYSKIFNTNRNNINICPGFAAIFEISYEEASELDRGNLFESFIKEKIKEGLSITKRDGSEFLKISENLFD